MIYVGALTFKPLAFQFRPWELTTTTVFNYVEGFGTLLFHRRGNQVQKITSPHWLQDQTRFSYDGFRRQRLTTPLVGGQPCGWPTAVAVWLTVIQRAGGFTFRVDPVSQVCFWWWFRLYQVGGHPGGQPTAVAVDIAISTPGVYHGAFGLSGVTAHFVALPLGLPYEEQGYLSSPIGVPLGAATSVAQLFAQQDFSYRVAGQDGGCHHYHGQVGTCALFQVSPLQRLLIEW